MKTFFNRTAIAILLGLLPAGVAAAQVTVATPPAGGGAVNVQAGPANVQAGPGGTNVAIPPGTAAAIQDNAAARQENRIDRREDRQADRQDNRAVNNNWRMRNYNNRWWYYHPNNTWSYYERGRWLPFRGVYRQYTASQTAPNGARRYSSGYRGPMPAPGTNTAPNTPASGTNTPPDNTAQPNTGTVQGNQ
ncbi:MAG TPA: hypothetical protein VHY91_26660 [Pirellulales bacterium]|jgi:hypothetical protein|nr:hypothetical protein [Pirellulales bacterium]